MWAGGTFDWNPAYPLAIGQKVTEMTRVEKVEFKNNMIFVHQEKKLLPGEGQSWGDDFSLKEIRTHVFRTTEDVSAIKGVKSKLLLPVAFGKTGLLRGDSYQNPFSHLRPPKRLLSLSLTPRPLSFYFATRRSPLTDTGSITTETGLATSRVTPILSSTAR